MKRSMQREWLSDILEAIPSVVFLALWRSDVGMQLSGWIGAALAALQLSGFFYLRIRNNPIMLGINVHLLVITPLIMIFLWVGARGISDTLAAHSYRGVLVTVFLVGCVLTATSKRGFIGLDHLSKGRRWTQSAILLAVSALTILWSFTYTGGTLFAVAIPMMVLFGLRRFIIARTLDDDNLIGGVGTLGIASMALGGTDADSA